MTEAGTHLEALAERVRARVAERRYGEARGIIREYCRLLRATVAALPCGDENAGRLRQSWLRLQEDVRRRVLAQRAHAVVRLAKLAASRNPYSGGPCARRTREWIA